MRMVRSRPLQSTVGGHRFTCSCIGCNRNVGLSGKVTFSDDGSPLPLGTVGFQKDGKVARGIIKEDGTYVVGFDRPENGLPPGKYDVYIAGAVVTIGSDRSGEGMPVSLINEKYNRADTSGLTLEVNASTKTYNIAVERYVPVSKGRH